MTHSAVRSAARLARLRPTFAVAALATCALLLGGAPPAAAGVAPVGNAKTLSSPKPIAAKMTVTPVAATDDTSGFGEPWAVFSRHNVVGRTADSTGDLIAVTASGHHRTFGLRTPDMIRFSAAGPILTAASTTDGSRVYWWRPPARGAQGGYNLAAMDAGARYLGSAPDGWVEIHPDGTLYDVDAAAGHAAVALGNPFGTALDVDGITGPAGVVVWNDAQIAFVPFAGGDATSLDVSNLTHLPGGSNTPVCWSASASAVACGSYYFTGEDDSGLRNVFVAPLDGGPAYAVSTKCPRPATVQGSRAGWLSCKGKLRVIGRDLLRTSSDKVGTEPVAGLGGFLTTGSSRHTGVRWSAGLKHTKTVLPSTRAVSETTRFALAGGAAVWMDNKSGGQVYRRTVATNSTHTKVAAGPVHRLARTHALRGSVVAAGKTVAFPTELTSSSVGHNGSETLRVLGPHTKARIHDVDRYLPIGIGAHRVAYYTDMHRARLYNLKTHNSKALNAEEVALSGHSLAYVTAQGAVRLKNLDNGKVRTVATGVHVTPGQLFVHGDVVAWNRDFVGVGGHVGFYRDMSSTAGVVQLPPNLNVWQLSNAGLVLEQSPSGPAAVSPNFPSDSGLRFHADMRFLLQPYDGAAPSTLLVASYLHAGPRVAGNVVAWVDRDGRLRARALG